MKVLKIVRAVFSTVGIGMLVASFFVFSSTTSFISRALEANGKVTDLERSRSSNSSTTYRPVVEFTTATGKRIEFVSSVGSSPPAERVRPSFYYAGTYAIDADNRKYEVLKDDQGTYLGSLGTGNTNWWGDYIDPGSSMLVWMRFASPPTGVNAVTLQLDGMEPIDDVRIQN